jgi:hypothetical protein
MTTKLVSFPLSLGRRDSVDPKLAPLGVLATCSNLRVAKDGRLVSRFGYQPLTMTFGLRTVQAFDLHEFNGRLLALCTSGADSYPTQALEYTGQGSTLSWFAETTGHELTPFLGLREMDTIPPPSSGIDEVDSAAGGGYICVCSRSVTGALQAVVIRESDGQMTASADLSLFSAAHFRVTFSVDTFYVAVQRANNQIDIISHRPGVSAGFALLATAAYASNATAATFDIVPVDNPTSTATSGARVCLAADHSTATDLIIRVFSGTGSQVGSDIALSGTDTISLSVNCDQTANRISLGIVASGGANTLRTYNMSSGALLVGPTTIVAAPLGVTTTITRIPAPASAGAATQVAVATLTTANNTVVTVVTEAAHATTRANTVSNAVITTRLIHWTPSMLTSITREYPVVFGGYVSPNAASTTDATNALFFCAPVGNANNGGWAHMATRDFTRATPRTMRNLGLHIDASTSRVTWCALRTSGSGTAQPAITTFARFSTERRQAVTFGGLRYFTGAPLQVYDGRCLTEPFQEVPGIISAAPSNSTGTLTNSATYSYVVHWECTLADGSFWQSAPSSPTSVTMGAADDTVTLTVSTPHHTAVAGGNDSSTMPDLTCVVSRTVFSDGIQGSIYRRSTTATISVGMTVYGANMQIIDLVPDSTLATAEALYTQGERGSLSGCLEHNGPRSSQYVAASESRLYLAGQLRYNQFQVSKEAFLEEPFNFSDFSTFFGQVAGRIRGVHSLDQVRLIFTADDIFAVPGAGPDDLGGGQLEAPIRIPTPSGLEDWRSLLEGPDGLFFQLDDQKLYLLPRGGGAPVWIGVDIQDTLASFPIITGACKSRRDDVLLFACQDTTAGTSARIIVRSQRTGVWSEDTPPTQSSRGLEGGIVSYGDTVAYVSGGTVYVQSASSYADNSSTAITTVLKTQPLYPFMLGGTGLIHDVLLVGEYRSAGTLSLRVSYNDGVSFSSLASVVLTGLTVGETVRRRWALPLVGAKSVILEWTFSPTVAGAGFVANMATLLVTPDDGLPELLPAEAA